MTRLFAALEPIQVDTDAAGVPRRFFWRAAWHPVEIMCNRWRIETTWWVHGAEAYRDYFKLATEDGLLVEIYRDLAGGGWYLARLYD